MIEPTDEDRKRARKILCWAGSGLEILQAKLAAEFAAVRSDALEKASALLLKPRCREWSLRECALAVRTINHPTDCSCHRWVDCGRPS